MEGIESYHRGRGCKGVEGGAKQRRARQFRRPYEITRRLHLTGLKPARAAAFPSAPRVRKRRAAGSQLAGFRTDHTILVRSQAFSLPCSSFCHPPPPSRLPPPPLHPPP